MVAKVKWFQVYDGEFPDKFPHDMQQIKTFEVADKLICLVKIEQGFYAIEDRCPHANGKLGMGKCDKKGMLTCPIHRYQYSVIDGKGLPSQGDCAAVFPVKINKDGLFIGLPQKPWWKFLFE